MLIEKMGQGVLMAALAAAGYLLWTGVKRLRIPGVSRDPLHKGRGVAYAQVRLGGEAALRRRAWRRIGFGVVLLLIVVSAELFFAWRGS